MSLPARFGGWFDGFRDGGLGHSPLAAISGAEPVVPPILIQGGETCFVMERERETGSEKNSGNAKHRSLCASDSDEAK